MPSDREVSFVRDYVEHFVSTLEHDELPATLSAARARFERVRDEGRKLMFAGNGASASIASHYALDYTKQAGIRAMSFNDAPLLTAYANDYGYERWLAKAIEHHGQSGDVAVLISTSGKSANMVTAAEQAASQDIDVVSFTGFGPGTPLQGRAAIAFCAESRAYNVVESVHSMWLGLLCDMIIGKREYSVQS